MTYGGSILLVTLNSDVCLQVPPPAIWGFTLHSQQYHISTLPKIPNVLSIGFMEVTQRLFVG